MLRRKVISAVSIVLLASSLTFALNIRRAEALEPALVGIMNNLGFTNIAGSTLETFPAGDYNVTVYALFAGWWQSNNLSWYTVGSNVYNDIFLGSEGKFGCLDPFVNRSFTANGAFGLSFISHEARYFTNTTDNPDGVQHAMVYANLDSSRPMYLIGFENTYGGGDGDYQDMVISLLELTHDVAITDVTALPSDAVKGDMVTVTVTAANLGDLPEDFSVAAYYDGAAIGTQPVSGLLPGENTILVFDWNTGGGPLGIFTVKANATVVPFEANTGNNEFIDSTVEIVNHDVAITAVIALPAKVLKGDPVTVTVTAANLGTLPEDFSVTAYYDSTAIGTEPVSNLLPSTTTDLIFNWDTTGAPLGTYTIKANATIVPFDTNTMNNEKIDNTVKIMQEPVAAFTHSPLQPIENDTTTFDATASTSTGGPIIDYMWDFGDGNITHTALKTIKHVYALFGTYTVTLTVEDSDHLTNSTSESVEVWRHDIAVVDVTPYRSWVYEGCPVDINVTLANLGNFTEDVDVDLYYNFTAGEKIGTLSVSVDPGATVVLTFTWNTTGVPYCHNYTITAVAKIDFENNMTNNMLDGTTKIKVRILGDVNGDGTVDMADIDAFSAAFMSEPEHPRWNPDCDISPCCPGDDLVDMMDISVVIQHFLESCSS